MTEEKIVCFRAGQAAKVYRMMPIRPIQLLKREWIGNIRTRTSCFGKRPQHGSMFKRFPADMAEAMRRTGIEQDQGVGFKQL